MATNKQIVSLLKKLISIDSVFPREQKLSIFISEYLKSIGMSVESVPVSSNRDNIIARLGVSKSYICFYGHMDTVPPVNEWQQDPFRLHQSGDILTGLGVADMKGGICSILLTANFASRNNIPIKIALGVDEENLSIGSFKLIQTDFFDDVAMIISGESGQVVNPHQDFAVNYGRKGRLVIEAFVKGKTAHMASSSYAENAIETASKFILALQKLRFLSHPKLGEVEIIPFEINSSTSTFSVPDLAKIEINLLTVPGVSSKEILEQIKHMCVQQKIDISLSIKERETPYMESYEVDTQNTLLKKIEDEVLSRFNVVPGYAQSVADENRFSHALNIPVISIGPIGGGDHTHKEWVSLKSLEKTVECYERIIQTVGILK